MMYRINKIMSVILVLAMVTGLGAFMLLSFSACKGSGINPSDYRLPAQAYIQYIAQLNTLEEAEGITADRDIVIRNKDTTDYNIKVIDKWTLKNDSDQDKTIKIAYATGQPYSPSKENVSVKINGTDTDYTQGVAYLKYYHSSPFSTVGEEFANGATEPDSTGTMIKKLSNKEYLQNALTEPDGELLDQKAFLYILSSSFDATTPVDLPERELIFRYNASTTVLCSKDSVVEMNEDDLPDDVPHNVVNDPFMQVSIRPGMSCLFIGEDACDMRLIEYTPDGIKALDPEEYPISSMVDRREGTLREILGWIAENSKTDVDNYRKVLKIRMLDWTDPYGYVSYRDSYFNISDPAASTLISYNFVDVTIPAVESVELEFDYTLTDTYRLEFIAGKYCDIECNEAVVTLEKSDNIVIYKQNMGFDEEMEKSSTTLDSEKEGLYIEYRVEGYVSPIH